VGLHGVIQQVNAALDATIIASTAIYEGDEAIFYNLTPPRLVWVLTHDGWRAPGGQAPRTTPATPGPAAQPSARLPKPIFTRVAYFEAHLWGADVGATDNMVEELARSMHEVGYGSLELPNGVWTNVAGAGQTLLGREYVLKGAFHLTVRARAFGEAGQAQATAIQRVMEHQRPDGSGEVVLDQTDQ